MRRPWLRAHALALAARHGGCQGSQALGSPHVHAAPNAKAHGVRSVPMGLGSTPMGAAKAARP